MTKEEAKKLLPIMQAFVEGKTIEMYLECDNNWERCFNPAFNPENKYRIKPEPKYRPFKDANECWNEMLKHQPFGWVREKETNSKFLVKTILNTYSYYDVHIGCNKYHLDEAFDRFAFIDNSPFGIKEV